MAKSEKSPVLGHVKCLKCNAKANVKRRKLGRGATTSHFFSWCPSCNAMEQKGDEQTQTRLSEFVPLMLENLNETPAVETPLIEPQAIEIEDFVRVAEVHDSPLVNLVTGQKPVLKTPMETPKKPRKFWLAAGLLSLGGALIAIARV